MKGLNIPFSFFDFFAYFTPGVIFLSGFLFILHFDISVLSYPPYSFIVDYWPVTTFVGIVISYIVGHVLTSFSKGLLENIIHKKLLRYPSDYILRKCTRPKFLTRLYREHAKQLEDMSYKSFCDKYKACFGKDIGEDTLKATEVFYDCRCFVMNNYGATWEMAHRFVSLYGYCRTLSFVFFALSGIAVYYVIVSICGVFDYMRLSYFIVSLILGIIFFGRYIKFFRLSTIELFLGFAANYDTQ